MLIPCVGGNDHYRLVQYPPPLELDEREGIYVLADDGPPETWRYELVARG